MAVTNNRRISELTPASEVNKEDLVVIVQNGETKNAPKRLVSEENYTSTEKTKLAGIEEGANNYVLPDDVVHTNDISDVQVMLQLTATNPLTVKELIKCLITN